MPCDLLLLHGAGLGAWIWDRVVPHLHLPALALDLPGRHDRTPLSDVTVEQSIQLVADHIRDDTAIVGHSFSAMIALAAASRKRAHVIAFGGVAPESGKAFLSTMPIPQRWLVGLMLRRAKNGIALPEGLVRRQYCNDLDRDTTELVLRNLVREAPRLYLDPVEWTSHAPSYVKLLRDESVSPRQQERMIARMDASRVESLRAEHLAMLAQPQETAVVLNRLSGQ